MNKYRKITLTTTLIGAAAVTISLWGVAQNPVGDQLEGIEINVGKPEDTGIANPDELADKITAEAAALASIKENGSEDDYFRALGKASDNALAAIDKLKPGSRAWHAVKNVLKDYNERLELAAFYYSGKGDTNAMMQFARRFIDLHLCKAFEGESLPKNDEVYPALLYNAASQAYNERDYERAIKYFKEYFATGSTLKREMVYTYMGQACINSKNYDLAVSTLSDGVKLYPDNEQMLMLAVKACVDGGHAEMLGPLVTRGLDRNPNNIDLLEIQARLYEDENMYDKALELWQRLDELNPQRLSTAKRIGLCYYNIGVNNFHDSQRATDDKTAKKLRRQAKNYFAGAADRLEEVLVSDPTSVKYLKALAVCYLCMEQEDKAREINDKLRALGAEPLEGMIVPPMVNYNTDGKKNYDWVVGSGVGENEAPLYSEFGSKYVTEALAKWITKGEFETVENYKKRVNQNTIKAEEERLNHEAQIKYLEQYSQKIRLHDLKLNPYDAQSETFMIESNCGPIFLKVPNKNNEAELFKSSWGGMRFQKPEFCIVNDRVNIASITVVSPAGKSYSYKISDTNINYAVHNVDIDLEAIMNRDTPVVNSTPTSYVQTEYVTLKSDVDENIPVNKQDNTNTFVLIVANGTYENGIEKVDCAEHDGLRFKEYCEKTLGIPEKNIQIETNASLGKFRRAINVLNNRVDAFGEPVDAIIYYAGHGMPDEKTKNAYLLPVDGDPHLIAETGIALDWLYKRLGEMKARSVMVFLDACFSGTTPAGGMLTSARAVALAARPSNPMGNMFVLSAAAGDETALSYRAKNHGMFTYFLLKKLQESKGNATLREISEYVINNVRREATQVNMKSQTPTYSLSGNMVEEWTKKKLR